MSRTSYAPKETYTGTGSLDTYTFDFKITDETQLEIIEVDDNGDETQRVRGDDVTYLSSVTFDAVDGGGTVVLAANLTLNYNLIILLADDSPTQTYEFRNKTSFTLRRFEDALDLIAGAVQRLAYRGRQGIRIHDLDDEETFNTQLPPGVATTANKVLIINSAGTGMEFGPTAGNIANAEGFADAAEASATAAAASESAASTSETNAASSASAAATSASAASTSATNAATSATNAATSETNAASSATAAASSATAAAASATSAADDLADIQALISPITTKETISDSQTNTDLTATIDETTHYAGLFEYFVTRGSTIEYGKLAIIDESPFTVTVLEKAGDAGVSFAVSESAGVGTLNYSSDAIGAGNIRWKFLRFEV